MNKERLVCVIMGQNADKYIEMCYNSVKDSDAIVFCDGGSSDGTISYLKSQEFKWAPSEGKRNLIFQHYDQLDKKMNGKQRNFYLNYVKGKYPDYWCLCIDVDEVVEDLDKIKEFINDKSPNFCSVKMRHLIGDLTHEDATQETHWVPHRLFKIDIADKYPESEHTVLMPKVKGISPFHTDCTTIWHLAYCPNLFDIKKRYESHLAKSEMHTPEYLEGWKNAHLFGTYPKKEFNPVELPRVILDNFHINKDELYFSGRGVETKHFIDAAHWRDFFECKNAIEFGCGRGPRVYAMNLIGINTTGIELSKYAVKNKFDGHVIQGNILDEPICGGYELAVAYDILEHIKYNDLDKAIDNLIHHTDKHILVSIPYKGTPNCDNDSTHIIKESREWWLNKFTEKGLKEVEVPEHFLFSSQLLIFSKPQTI